MDMRQLILLHHIIFILLFLFNFGLGFEEDYDEKISRFSPGYHRCPWIKNELKNGRVKLRSRGRIAKFFCDTGYELAGKRFATCVRGQWNNPIPVCVARGCTRMQHISNGYVTEEYRGAMLTYECNPGYSLHGPSSIFCDGRRWSSAAPACVVTTSDPEMTCDFEELNLCGWSHDPQSDFDWKRNHFSTPSGHVGTGPSYDHTFGIGKAGFYLYLEASSPRKADDKTRLFSPVFPSSYSDGCFVLWYHMYGSTTGSLRVYVKPESHVFGESPPTWEKIGEQGNQWLRGHIPIPHLYENFQIVIEGVRGSSYVGDTAIDDVQLSKNRCESMDNDTDTVSSTVAESCRGRCGEPHSEQACGCSEDCFTYDICCHDYIIICSKGNDTTGENPEEQIPSADVTSSVAQELTEGMQDVTTKSSESYIELTAQTTLYISTSVTERSTLGTTGSSSAPTTAPTTTKATTETIPETTTQNVNYETTVKTSVAEADTTPTKTSTVVTFTTSPTVPSTTSPAVPSTTSKRVSSTVSTRVQSTTSTRVQSTTSTRVPFTTSNRVRSTTSTTVPSSPSTRITSTTLKPSTFTTPEKTTARPSVTNTSGTTESASFPEKTQFSTSVASNTNISSTNSVSYLPPQATRSSPLTVSRTSVILSTDISNLTNTPFPMTSSETSVFNTEKTYTDKLQTQPVVNTVSTTEPYSSRPQTWSDSNTVSTREPYNLRPRNRTTSTITTTTTTASSTTMSNTENTRKIFPQTFKTVIPRVYEYSLHTTSSTKRKSTTMQLFSTSTSTAKTALLTDSTPIRTPITTDFIESNGSEAASTANEKSSSVGTIVAITIVVIIGFAAGLVYYMRKKVAERRNKLADDSEMRFLSDNEETEYSDASVLEKILGK